MIRKIILLTLLLGISLASSAQSRKSLNRSSGNEFSNMAREIRVSRHVIESLEDHQSTIDYAIRHEQLTPAEQRRIKSMIAGIQRKLDRCREKGAMSKKEAAAIYADLSKLYRTIWIMRRNEAGKYQKIVFFGYSIILKEQYREKFKSGSLNAKEQREIMHCYYYACRIREQMNDTNLKKSYKQRLKNECFRVLSEYFTIDQNDGKTTIK